MQTRVKWVSVILSRGDGEGSQNATDRSLRSFAALRMTTAR
jgi:hypothetical protein